MSGLEKQEAKAQQLIDGYLAWKERHLRPDPTQIEDIALLFHMELGQEIALMVLEVQAGSWMRWSSSGAEY
jgi:hypothetical protein